MTLNARQQGASAAAIVPSNDDRSPDQSNLQRRTEASLSRDLVDIETERSRLAQAAVEPRSFSELQAEAQRRSAESHQRMRSAGLEEAAKPLPASTSGALTSRIAGEHQRALQQDALILGGSTKRRTGNRELDDFIDLHPELAPAAARDQAAALEVKRAAEAGRSGLESKGSLESALQRVANRREGQAAAPELRLGDRAEPNVAGSKLNALAAGITSAVANHVSKAETAAEVQPAEQGWIGSSWSWLCDVGAEVRDAGKGLLKMQGDIRRWVIEKAEAAGKLAWDVVTDPFGTVRSVWKGTCWLFDKTWDGIVWLGENGWEGIKAVGRGCVALAVGTWDVACGVADGVAGLSVTLGKTAWKAAGALVGKYSWSEVGATFSENWDKTKAAFVKAAEVAVDLGKGVVYGAIKVAKCTWGLVKGMSDALGVTDMVVGAYYLVKAQPQLLVDLCRAAIGQGTFGEAFGNYGDNLKNAGRCAVGALKCLGQVTGVIDAALFLKHSVNALACYGRGDNMGAAIHGAQAAMHGAFAALSFTTFCATVATLGAAGESMAAVALGRSTLKEAGKQVLDVAAKEFLKTESKQLAKLTVEKIAENAVQVVEKELGDAALKALEAQALKELGEEATEEMQKKAVEQLALKLLLRREAESMALKGGEMLAKEAAEKGVESLSKESVEALMHQVGEDGMKALLKKLQMTECVHKVVLAMLGDVSKGNVKELSAKLAQQGGMSEGRARLLVEGMRKALKSPRYDKAMMQVLEDGMTADISAVFCAEMEQPFKAMFSKALSGEVEEQWSKDLAIAVSKRAEGLGVSAKAFTEELVEAGWKGTSAGIEAAVRQSVREGIERAFKDFRRRGIRVFASGEAEAETGLAPEEVQISYKDIGGKSKAAPLTDDVRFEGMAERFREEVIDLGDGREKIVHLVFEPSINKWIPVSSEIVTFDDLAEEATETIGGTVGGKVS